MVEPVAILARHGFVPRGRGRCVRVCRIHNAPIRATSHACKTRMWALPRHLQHDLRVHSLLCFCSAASASLHTSRGRTSCHVIREKGNETEESERRKEVYACLLAMAVLPFQVSLPFSEMTRSKNDHCCNLPIYQFGHPETQTDHARTVARTFKPQFAPGVVHPDMHRSH